MIRNKLALETRIRRLEKLVLEETDSTLRKQKKLDKYNQECNTLISDIVEEHNSLSEQAAVLNKKYKEIPKIKKEILSSVFDNVIKLVEALIKKLNKFDDKIVDELKSAIQYYEYILDSYNNGDSVLLRSEINFKFLMDSLKREIKIYKGFIDNLEYANSNKEPDDPKIATNNKEIRKYKKLLDKAEPMLSQLEDMLPEAIKIDTYQDDIDNLAQDIKEAIDPIKEELAKGYKEIETRVKAIRSNFESFSKQKQNGLLRSDNGDKLNFLIYSYLNPCLYSIASLDNL